jgi:ATP-dependent RNA helicase DeaD
MIDLALDPSETRETRETRIPAAPPRRALNLRIVLFGLAGIGGLGGFGVAASTLMAGLAAPPPMKITAAPGRAGRKGTSVLLIPNSRRRRAEQMFAIAKVSPEWSGPPSADEIRRLDGERMLSDPLFAEPPAEEDVALAGTLLASKSPEELAALLARVYRTRLPAPEEVSDPGEGRAPRGERPPYDPMDPERIAAMGPAVWFRLNLGRRDNADPRRLLPMLTRRGGIGRQEIGAIRIFDRETKFEVRGNAAARFAEAFARNGSPEIQVEALSGDGAPAERPGRGGPKGFASPRAGKHQRKVERTGPRPERKPDRHSGQG